MKQIVLSLLVTTFLTAAPTTLLYQPASTTKGPFPSNVLARPEGTQQTGLQIQLPPSSNSCAPSSAPSVCSSLPLLNQLDGFSVNPRSMVCFSAPINPDTLAGALSIAPLNGGAVVPANQVIYDVSSRCAFAKPNQVLNQQTQYVLLVNNAIRDWAGQPVIADPAFLTCLNSSDPNCSALSSAVRRLVKPPASVVTASLFTTMSATTWLEKARAYVDRTPSLSIVSPPIPLSSLTEILWVPQDNTGSTAHQQTLPLKALSDVQSIAFGAYLSPNFISLADGTIPPTPTNQALPSPYFPAPVSFHVFQPASAKPKNGYPVVVYGHGLSDNQFGASTYAASTLAKRGFATLAFEVLGHGYGLASVVKLTDVAGIVTTVPTPGRGILLPGKTQIDSSDGCIAPGAVGVRDCGRQTAVDLFALVNAIQQNDDLGLDPSRIYYVGQSFGGTYGTLFQAVEPSVKTAVLNGAGGTSIDVARLAITARPLGAAFLAPLGLLNAPPPDYFQDNYVFRNAPTTVNNIPGAMAIQAAFEAAEWLGMLGDPLSFAPHLQNSQRLASVPAKSTLFQFGQGDLEVPNSTELAVVSAAGAQSAAWFFLFGQAAASHPELLGVTTPDVSPLPILPHRILANPTIFNVPAETSIAIAEQRQAAAFFESNGSVNPDPNQFVAAPFSPGQQLFQPLIPTSGGACNGTYYGVFSGNITIAAGQSCIFLSGGVTGNVIDNGGGFTLTGATVSGSVTVNGASNVSIGPASSVSGNVIIQNVSAGGSAKVCDANITGNVTLQGNATPSQIGAVSSCPGNSISGNLVVQGVTAPVAVFGNTVSGNLVCQGNTSITGSGNAATQKQGQCANF